MTKLTPQELDERIENLSIQLRFNPLSYTAPQIKQLIRDCIEAVTPVKQKGGKFGIGGFNQAITTIEANTKELLGNTNTEGNK